jgi:hypothetical protein
MPREFTASLIENLLICIRSLWLALATGLYV